MNAKGKNRQKYAEGVLVKIELPRLNKIGFGRLFINRRIGVYDYFIGVDEKLPTIKSLNGKGFIFFVTIFEQVITKGDFEIIDFSELSQTEIETVPPQFTQDKVNLDECIIFYPKDRIPERKATAIECIGLEISSVWDSNHVMKRMEDFCLNKKNYSEEAGKVILSKDDIRYIAHPGILRWDFEKGEFYRTE